MLPDSLAQQLRTHLGSLTHDVELVATLDDQQRAIEVK